MRSHEERFAETKRRIAARQRREQRRRSTITTLSAAAAYIVIGLFSFLLGVCVTVLCFRLRQINREDSQDREDEGRHGAD